MDKEFNLVHIFTIFYNIADERMERGKKGKKVNLFNNWNNSLGTMN